MAVIVSRIQATSPASQTFVAPVDQSKKCCYRGFDWTHVITIPGALAGTVGLVYGLFMANYPLVALSGFAGVASIVGAIRVVCLKPQEDLETDINEFSSLNEQLKLENTSLKARIEALDQTSREIAREVDLAGRSINAVSSGFQAVDGSLRDQLLAADQREAELKRLLERYQGALTQMTAQVHAMTGAETTMDASLVDLHKVDAEVGARASEIDAAAVNISREENELEVANRKFSELNRGFQQKLELLGSLIRTIKTSHAAMTDRVTELGKVQSDLDQTKQKLEKLIPQMERLTRIFAQRTQVFDSEQEAEASSAAAAV